MHKQNKTLVIALIISTFITPSIFAKLITTVDPISDNCSCSIIHHSDPNQCEDPQIDSCTCNRRAGFTIEPWQIIYFGRKRAKQICIEKLNPSHDISNLSIHLSRINFESKNHKQSHCIWDKKGVAGSIYNSCLKRITGSYQLTWQCRDESTTSYCYDDYGPFP